MPCFSEGSELGSRSVGSFENGHPPPTATIAFTGPDRHPQDPPPKGSAAARPESEALKLQAEANARALRASCRCWQRLKAESSPPAPSAPSESSSKHLGRGGSVRALEPATVPPKCTSLVKTSSTAACRGAFRTSPSGAAPSGPGAAKQLRGLRCTHSCPAPGASGHPREQLAFLGDQALLRRFVLRYPESYARPAAAGSGSRPTAALQLPPCPWNPFGSTSQGISAVVASHISAARGEPQSNLLSEARSEARLLQLLERITLAAELLPHGGRDVFATIHIELLAARLVGMPLCISLLSARPQGRRDLGHMAGELPLGQGGQLAKLSTTASRAQPRLSSTLPLERMSPPDSRILSRPCCVKPRAWRQGRL